MGICLLTVRIYGLRLDSQDKLSSRSGLITYKLFANIFDDDEDGGDYGDVDYAKHAASMMLVLMMAIMMVMLR